jgi:hypothetical protein
MRVALGRSGLDPARQVGDAVGHVDPALARIDEEERIIGNRDPSLDVIGDDHVGFFEIRRGGRP